LRASGSAPSKAKTGPDDLVRVMRDERIVALRRDGLTYGPSSEQVEELRHFQGAQLDHYQAQLAPHLMRALRNDDGEIIYDGNGDDRQPIRVPDVQVGQMWLRVLERRAKLYGLDMQVGVSAPEVTAEMMAAFLFDENDPRYMGERAIDVDGEEVDDDRRALGIGPGD
jgi:hypothetical protein